MDQRTTLARPDLADAALQGVLPAARYAPTVAYRCTAPSAAIRRRPDALAEQLDQLLYGETFRVLEIENGWAWGQADRDGYVGFVDMDDLTSGAKAATHRMADVRARAFTHPDPKSEPLGVYTMNALVTSDQEQGGFVRDAGAGWLPASALAPIGETEDDIAGVACRFLGATYVWGGRDSLGLDCSALVQHALFACGRACPRDTDQQAGLGKPAPPEALQRGDLVFWKGHVGVMLDGERLLHANATFMQVSIEPLVVTSARVGAPTAYRRL